MFEAACFVAVLLMNDPAALMTILKKDAHFTVSILAFLLD